VKPAAFRLFAAALALAGTAALAQSEPPVELTGTLAKGARDAFGHRRAPRIRRCRSRTSRRAASRSATRSSSAASSWRRSARRWGRELEIKWLPVTSDSRIEAIASGRADLECGSTTSNLERQKTVAFSPTIFVSGTKLMVKRGSPIKSFRDLPGQDRGGDCRNHQRADDARHREEVPARFPHRGGARPRGLLRAGGGGQGRRLATDDVLLYGLIAQKGLRGQYVVTGEFLSYDPYGIMYRKGDAQLARLVDDAFHELAEDGEWSASTSAGS
jgi:glutamate/aspartate transport system substrate-binding protein